jgi:hypothetical protein
MKKIPNRLWASQKKGTSSSIELLAAAAATAPCGRVFQ